MTPPLPTQPPPPTLKALFIAISIGLISRINYRSVKLWGLNVTLQSGAKTRQASLTDFPLSPLSPCSPAPNVITRARGKQRSGAPTSVSRNLLVHAAAPPPAEEGGGRCVWRSTLIELTLQLGAPALQGFDTPLPPPPSPPERREERGQRCNSTAVKTRPPGAARSERNSGTVRFCIYSSSSPLLGSSFTSASYLPPVI